MYEGSAARRLDTYEGYNAQQQVRSPFEVVEGAGLDAQVRRGVSPQLLARLKVIFACAVVLCTIGVARVAVYTATASLLSANSTMRNDLSDARASREELRVERTVLSSNQRIARIAESYGMVLVEDSETMTVGDAQAAIDAAAQEASSEVTHDKSTEAEASEAEASAAEESSEQTSQEAVADALSQASQTLGDGSGAGANAVDVDSL